MIQKKSGIYCLTNLVHGRLYIGSSINLVKRRYAHFNCLENGTHSNTHLQNSWNKHNGQFSFTILEYCEPEKVLEREQWWMDLYGIENLYNSSPTAGNSLGVKMPKEVIDKLRVTVDQIDMMTGEIIKSWLGMTQAALALGISASHISKCCKGKRASVGGFIWKYNDENDSAIFQYKPRNTGRKIHQLDSVTFKTIKVWDSAYEAGTTLGIHPNSIRNVALGVTKSCIKFYWDWPDVSLKERKRQRQLSLVKNRRVRRVVLQLDAKTNKVIKEWIDGAIGAAEELGFRKASIRDCCNGRIQTYKKFKWQYA